MCFLKEFRGYALDETEGTVDHLRLLASQGKFVEKKAAPDG